MLQPTRTSPAHLALYPASAFPSQSPTEDVWHDAKLIAIHPRPPIRLQLFPPRTAPSPYDVRQHVLFNDCHVLAPMMAVVGRFAYYPHCMLKNVGHAVRVRYFSAVGAPPTQVSLATDLLHVSLLGTRVGAGGPWLWPAYLEKAWAATHGGLVALQTPSEPTRAFGWLLGCPSSYVSVAAHRSINDVLATLAQLYAQGECIVVYTQRHCYAVVGVRDGDKTAPSLTLLDSQRDGLGRREYVWSPSMTSSRYIGYAYTSGAAAAMNSVIRLDTTSA